MLPLIPVDSLEKLTRRSSTSGSISRSSRRAYDARVGGCGTRGREGVGGVDAGRLVYDGLLDSRGDRSPAR